MGGAYPRMGDSWVSVGDAPGRVFVAAVSAQARFPALPIGGMFMDAAPTSIDDLLSRAVEAGASDLHLVPGALRPFASTVTWSPSTVDG